MSFSSATNLRLPPFGKILQAYCDEKIHPVQQIHIYLGVMPAQQAEIIEAKRYGGMLTYLSNIESPYQYRWPVQGQNVIVYDFIDRDDNGDFATIFALYLIESYQAKAVVITSNFFPMNIFHGVQTHG